MDSMVFNEFFVLGFLSLFFKQTGNLFPFSYEGHGKGKALYAMFIFWEETVRGNEHSNGVIILQVNLVPGFDMEKRQHIEKNLFILYIFWCNRIFSLENVLLTSGQS